MSAASAAGSQRRLPRLPAAAAPSLSALLPTSSTGTGRPPMLAAAVASGKGATKLPECATSAAHLGSRARLAREVRS